MMLIFRDFTKESSVIEDTVSNEFPILSIRLVCNVTVSPIV